MESIEEVSSIVSDLRSGLAFGQPVDCSYFWWFYSVVNNWFSHPSPRPFGKKQEKLIYQFWLYKVIIKLGYRK